jgi:chain length determinant protein EpsF
MSFQQIVAILRARLRMVLGIFAAVVALALVVTLIWPAQYTATSSIVVEAKTDPVAGANGGAGYTEQMLASYVNTQADVVASERVAQRVVKTLKLDQDPALRAKWQSATHGRGDMSVWLADYILDKKLTVAPVHDSPTHASNVIEISVAWRDPNVAAALANSFAQSAIDTNIELKVEPAKQYAAWFNQRSAALHKELEEKQKRLSDFQNASGLVATDEKLDVENERLAELSTQLVTIQALRQDSQSRQRQSTSNMASLPEVLQSPVIQSLKADLAQAEAKLPDIQSRVGKNHPDYQALVAEIANLRTRIAQESANIAASLGSTTQVNIRKENDVRAALDAQKKKVLDLKHEHDEAAVLASDVAAAQRDLDAVTERFAQSSLESQANQTNVVQLTVATPPVKPSSPKLLLNLLAAILLGGMLGVGMALMLEIAEPRVRLEGDLPNLLGIPMLGKIGSVSKRAIDASVASRHSPNEFPAV